MPFQPAFFGPSTTQFAPGYMQQQAVMAQPINGLVRVESIEGAQMYPLPPNSVSPPLFLGSDNVFFIKTTDGGGAPTIKKYRFDEEQEPAATTAPQGSVTKEEFDSFKAEIMEVLNGKHPVSE